MNVTLLVITDGRGDCLTRTLLSFEDNVFGPIAHRLMIDDSANERYAKFLDESFSPDFKIVHHRVRRGFASAIQSAWANLPPDTDFVFHLEDDFTFNGPVNIIGMIRVLQENPALAQLALKRQAIGPEVQFGGFIEQWLDAYTDKEWDGFYWCEHRNFFTTNPSLYPMPITAFGWPEGPNSEAKFGPRLWEAGYVAGFWGKKMDRPRVTHIGDVRVGVDY